MEKRPSPNKIKTILEQSTFGANKLPISNSSLLDQSSTFLHTSRKEHFTSLDPNSLYGRLKTEYGIRKTITTEM
jgi:hypothetical protein